MVKERWLILAAFGVIYFVWGSTYLANYWAIGTIPPFLMCGSRFFVAGVLLFLFTLPMGGPWPNQKQWLNATGIGVLFLGIGTAAVVWAQQFVPTSLTALIVSFNPLIIMLLMWALLGNRPRKLAFVGAATSIFGVILLVDQPQLGGNPNAYKGLLAIFAALFSWAIAAIKVSRTDMGQNRIRATAMQMITGGGLILLFSLSIGEANTWDPYALDLRSFLAWGYLVIFGSIIAFSSFNFLLSRVSPEKVATSTYVNPLVALVLGGWLNNELITNRSLLAGVVMLTGVYFINSSK